MKRFFILLSLFVCLGQVHAQIPTPVAIMGATTDALISALHVDQVAFHIQAGMDAASQIGHLVRQGEMWAESLERSLLNMRRLGEVSSWNDFMDWYNRQLYMEQQTQQAFENMNVSIGNKTYSLFDVESMQSMGRDLDDVRIDFWNEEFTSEQRKEMWLRLGLTPSNYAYVQTWKEKEMELARKFLTSPGIQNNEYMQQMIRNNKWLQRLAGNADLPEEEQLGEPEVAAMGVEVAIDTNKTLNDIKMLLTDLMQLKAVEIYQSQNPKDRPVLSDWPEDVFGALN